jgi:hypothetical protein
MLPQHIENSSCETISQCYTLSAMSKDQQQDQWLVPHTKAPVDWLQPVTPEQKRYKDRLINHLKPRLPTEQERKEVVDYIMAILKIPELDRWQIETFYDVYTSMPMVVFDNSGGEAFWKSARLNWD